jgi:hypothetical protein
LSTRALPELVGVGRNDEATTRVTWSPERGKGELERVRERGGRVMSQRTSWETPIGRYDEHNSKFSLSMKPKFNRLVGERNHF